MSINRVPIGGTANNQYHGQGQFCYYRKGSAVSGVTDVAVYVDSAYMGLMSPTEHFSLNTKGTFWEFKPVDPLLVGEFVLADTAEEYGSSAVAGAVSVSGGSLTVSNLRDDYLNKTLSASANGDSFMVFTRENVLTTNNAYFFIYNPVASPSKTKISKVFYKNDAIGGNFFFEKLDFTGDLASEVDLATIGDASVSVILAAKRARVSNSTVSGQNWINNVLGGGGQLAVTGSTGILFADDLLDTAMRFVDFEGGMTLRPGQGILMSYSNPTNATSVVWNVSGYEE